MSRVQACATLTTYGTNSAPTKTDVSLPAGIYPRNPHYPRRLQSLRFNSIGEAETVVIGRADLADQSLDKVSIFNVIIEKLPARQGV